MQHAGKVLLTGGTGFLGNRVGQELVRRGYQVIVATRSPEKVRGTLSFPCELLQWTEPKYDLEKNLIGSLTAVIHLAGESIAGGRWTSAYKERLRRSRVDSTTALAEAMRRFGNPGQVFIQASGIGYYGDTGESVYGEEQLAGDDFLGQLAQAWEGAASPLDTVDIRRVALRFGMLLGTTGGALAELLPLYARGFGARLGSGKQWLSWLHIDDAVGLIIAALQDDRWRGPVNACSPQPVRQHAFHRALCQHFGSWTFVAAPRLALQVAVGPFAAALLSSQRALPQAALSRGYAFRFPQLDGALSNLFAPRQRLRSQIVQLEQWLPLSPDELWPFFSNAQNLERLTPPFLNFHVKKVHSQELGSGTLIDYRLKLHGIPLGWRTRLEQWEPPHRFVDTQLTGPYSLWHHTHSFTALGSGTLMTDRVEYSLPLAPLSTVVAGPFVDRDVRNIFRYRVQAARDIFFKT